MSVKIGLLGGTFDPVHIGHISIANSFLKSKFIDELWIIPSANPPHKKEEKLTGFEHRLKMLELAFLDIRQVRICDIEYYLPSPSYTIQTVRYLKKKYPAHEFFLCMGEDSLVDFRSWYQAEQIIEECKLLVARRPNIANKQVDPQIQKNILFISHDPLEISSTELRKSLYERKEKLDKYIPSQVLDYINQHDLYT